MEANIPENMSIEEIKPFAEKLIANLEKVIIGKHRTLEFVLVGLLCQGHILIEDVPGVSVFNQVSRQFEFRAGPIMTQILLADEINRATPKTQSALLEAMEEHQTTVC